MSRYKINDVILFSYKPLRDIYSHCAWGKVIKVTKDTVTFRIGAMKLYTVNIDIKQATAHGKTVYILDKNLNDLVLKAKTIMNQRHNEIRDTSIMQNRKAITEQQMIDMKVKYDQYEEVLKVYNTKVLELLGNNNEN